MKKAQRNPDRVGRDAYEREQERIAREREAIAEMAGESSEEDDEQEREKDRDGDRE